MGVDMSEKKPVIIVSTRPREVCPVCGKVSYSRSGEHPQCAVARADANTRAARKAAGIEPSKSSSRRPWFRLCPKCKVQVPARRAVCNCGYSFEPEVAGANKSVAAAAATKKSL
jgi:hypothetical protein